MGRRLLPCAAIVAAVFLGGPLAGAAAGPPTLRVCARTAHADGIEARRVPCARARHLAESVIARGRGPRGWRCRRLAVRGFTAFRCVRGLHRVSLLVVVAPG